MFRTLRRIAEALEAIRDQGTSREQLELLPSRVDQLDAQMKSLQLEATELYEKVWSALKRLEKRQRDALEASRSDDKPGGGSTVTPPDQWTEIAQRRRRGLSGNSQG